MVLGRKDYQFEEMAYPATTNSLESLWPKELSGKEMAKKYGYKSPASITTEVVKVINYIKKDPKIYARFVDIYELIKEHREDVDEYEDTTYDEPVSVSALLKEDKEKEKEDLQDAENYPQII